LEGNIPKGVIMAALFFALSVKGMLKNAFFISTTQKMLNLADS
jgi:hypothetical protein